MRKFYIFILSALILFGASVSAGAQSFIVKGGVAYVNAPKISEIADYNYGGYTGWMVGIGYQTGTFGGFSVQPELIYKVKGVNLDNFSNIKMNYLEIPVNFQFGPNLLICRPYVIASPYIGFNLAATADGNFEIVKNTIEKVEYGLGLGAGIDVWRLQLAFKYNWNFGRVVNLDSYLKNINSKNINAANGGFEVTVGFIF